MPEPTFEERFARQLSTYAEAGVRSFDPYVVARATIGSRPRWGRLARPMLWQGSTARALRFALTMSLMLALLLVAMLAAGGLLPGGKPPSNSGLFVWSDGVATFVGPDGELATRSAPSVRGDGCPLGVVAGSGVVAQGGFGKIHLTDLVGDIDAQGIDTNYGGGERWSADLRHVALMRFSGTVTVVSLVDPGSLQKTTFDTPGVLEAALTPDGRYLAVARGVEGATSVAVDLMDVSAGAVDPVRTFRFEGVDAESAGLDLAPDGSHVAIGLFDRGSQVLGDVATGDVVDLPSGWYPAAWSPDGTRLALTDGNGINIVDDGGVMLERLEPAKVGVQSLGWSPDGSHLAFMDGVSLVVTDPAGSRRAELTLKRMAFEWTPDGSGLYVASAETAADGTRTIVVQRYGPDLIAQGEPVILPGHAGSGPVCFAPSDVVVTPGGGASAP